MAEKWKGTFPIPVRSVGLLCEVMCYVKAFMYDVEYQRCAFFDDLI